MNEWMEGKERGPLNNDAKWMSEWREKNRRLGMTSSEQLSKMNEWMKKKEWMSDWKEKKDVLWTTKQNEWMNGKEPGDQERRPINNNEWMND